MNYYAELLQPIIANFWKTEALLDELAEGIIAKLLKKDKMSEKKIAGASYLACKVNKIIAHIVEYEERAGNEPGSGHTNHLWIRLTHHRGINGRVEISTFHGIYRL